MTVMESNYWFFFFFKWIFPFVIYLDNILFTVPTCSEISHQSDRCWWNHHCNDAILSHTLTLVAYNVRRRVFTKFEVFSWIKMSWIPKFSGYNNSSPILLSNTFYTQPDKKIHFWDNNRRIFLVKWTGWGIHRDNLSKQCCFTYKHRLYTGGSQNFQTSWELMCM